jgi:hypothetical protein
MESDLGFKMFRRILERKRAGGIGAAVLKCDVLARLDHLRYYAFAPAEELDNLFRRERWPRRPGLGAAQKAATIRGTDRHRCSQHPVD